MAPPSGVVLDIEPSVEALLAGSVAGLHLDEHGDQALARGDHVELGNVPGERGRDDPAPPQLGADQELAHLAGELGRASGGHAVPPWRRHDGTIGAVLTVTFDTNVVDHLECKRRRRHH